MPVPAIETAGLAVSLDSRHGPVQTKNSLVFITEPQAR